MQNLLNPKAIIITGGPGTGKTSVIEKLSSLGYHCVMESGRGIIQKEVKRNGENLPWKNPRGFAQAMFEMAKRDYIEAIHHAPYTFFDRGLPDVMGYLRVCQLNVPRAIRHAAAHYRYHQRVFIMPPWPEIYRQDQERKQSISEAIATYHRMVDVYQELGYTLVELPRDTIQKRVDFLLQHLD